MVLGQAWCGGVACRHDWSKSVTTFIDRLAELTRARAAPLVVGLDPRYEKLPRSLTQADQANDPAERARAYVEFCRGVIDVVAELVPAVKPQAAFFEQLGPPGMAALAEVIDYAHWKGLLVILDAKRNDIGSTAAAYAEGILGPKPASAWGADALTVSPYLGDDSLEPFVRVAAEREAGVFVLVKTSNPGGKMFQDLAIEATGARPGRLYQHVGALVERLSADNLGDCGYGAVGAVAGATYPQELASLRREMPHTWFLVPGFGSQGGAAGDVAGAFDANGLGATVNSSRAIIFAHARPEYANLAEARWQDAVATATRDAIETLRSETPAGNL